MESNLLLQWNDYQSGMTSSLLALLASNSFLDATVTVSDGSLRCHRLVLAAASDRLAQMLRDGDDNDGHSVVSLNDMQDLKLANLERIVRFIYAGQVDVPADELHAFLSAARELQIKGIGEQADNIEASRLGVVDQNGAMGSEDSSQRARTNDRVAGSGSRTNVFTVVGLDALGNPIMVEGRPSEHVVVEPEQERQNGLNEEMWDEQDEAEIEDEDDLGEQQQGLSDEQHAQVNASSAEPRRTTLTQGDVMSQQCREADDVESHTRFCLATLTQVVTNRQDEESSEYEDDLGEQQQGLSDEQRLTDQQHAQANASSAIPRRTTWKRSYEGTRRYKTRWEALYPWVRKALDGSQHPYCKVCSTTLTCKSHALQVHEKTTKHRRRMRSALLSDY